MPSQPDPAAAGKSNERDTPEWRLSHWVDHALDRILLPPCRYTAQDSSGRAMGGTSEERRQKRMIWEQKRRWYGVKPYQLDWRVSQEMTAGTGMHRVAEIELKWGTDTTTNQDETIRQCQQAGLVTGVARSITEFAELLHFGGFKLHPNWRNILVEVEARHAAAHDSASSKPRPKPKRTSRPRTARATPAQIQRAIAGGWYGR